jgi:uncharacterized protein (TIGR02246 family)
MKRIIVFFLLFFIPFFSVMGKESKVVNLEKEQQAILAQDKKWVEAAQGKDIELIASFWSDDAVVYAPGLPPVVGKDAIREFVRHSQTVPGFSIRWNTIDVQLSDDGTLAYATGTNQTTYNDPDGKLVTVNGKTITVWRKDSSRIWRCVVDIWNDNPTK